MRGGRSLLVLLVIALGLGAYIYFVERDRDPAAADAREKAFTVEPADITGLTVRGASGETTTLRRTGETWTLAAPVEAPADSAVLESILSSLSTLTIDRVIDEQPAALDQYGLDTPRMQVDFTTGDGATHHVQLGGTTPTNSGIYARIDDATRVVLVPAFVETTFDKTSFDLRDRRVLDIARDTVDRLTLTPRSGPAIDMRRDGVNWRLTAPIDARADFSPADGLLGRLTTAQMSSVVKEGAEPTAAELRTWGLDAPQLTATVGSGSTTATLAIGAARDDAAVYARDLSRPIVFTVDSSLLTDLRKDPADLRVKDIFAFNAFSASSLELSRDGTSTTWEKTTPSSGADAATQPTWARTKPDAGEVNQTAMTDLLNALSALRADRFVSQVPSAGETLDVVVRSGSADAPVEERATLRRVGDTAYAVRAGEPGGAVIATTDFEAVLTHLTTLTTPAAPETPPAAP